MGVANDYIDRNGQALCTFADVQCTCTSYTRATMPITYTMYDV